MNREQLGEYGMLTGRAKGMPEQPAIPETCVETLKSFASLLETHRYYGSVAATSAECLQVQRERLPRLFEPGGNSPCCLAPSLILEVQQHVGSKLSFTENAKQSIGRPVSFTRHEVTALPLHLLEGCTRIFQTLWKTRVDLAAKTISVPQVDFIDQIPMHPSAVVTLLKCLSPLQMNSGLKLDDGIKVVLPVIVNLVMDWKLQDDSTSTLRMDLPGILIGKLHNVNESNSCAKTIKHAELELDYDTMLKAMTDQINPFLQKVFSVGWVALTKRKLMTSLLAQHQSTATTSWGELGSIVEEQGTIDHSEATPLEALFAGYGAESDQSGESVEQPGDSVESDELSPPGEHLKEEEELPECRAESNNGSLSVLSAAAEQMSQSEEEPPLKRQKHAGVEV